MSVVPILSPFDTDINRQLTEKRQNQEIGEATQHLSGIAKAYFSSLYALSYCLPTSIQVQTSYDVIVSHWGVVTEVLRTPGFYWLSSAGLEIKEVYVGSWIGSIEKIPLNDRDGFPCFGSISYTYQVVDVLAATYLTSDHKQFIENHAKTAFQNVFFTIPYYQRDSNKFQRAVIKLLQDYVEKIGVKIQRFVITQLSVSQKMQKLLLAKQEAQSYITGRKTIAEGATKVLESTLKSLQEKGIELTEAHKHSLVVDFIYMMCQEEKMVLRLVDGAPTMSKLINLTAIS